MSRSRAHRLIDAATVYETVLPIGNILPANEAQARPLVRLEPEQRVAVWQEAEATAVNGKPTAAHIEHVAQTLYPPATAAPVPPPPTSVHFLSDSEEWYTPLYVIERAIEFFGEIDLDPCAPDKLVPVVPARTIYTKADDGLVQPWSGRVWMNPPYGESIGFWIQKLITAYRDGSIEAGLALLPSRTEAAWFSPLWDFPLCFVRGRLKFRNPAGKENGAPFGSVIACISGDVDEFARWFGDLGHIVNAH